MEGGRNKSNPFLGSNYFHGESSNSNNFNLNLKIDDVSSQQLGEQWLSPLINQAQATQQIEQTHGALLSAFDLDALSIGGMQPEQDSMNMKNAPQFSIPKVDRVIPKFERGNSPTHMQGNLGFPGSRIGPSTPRNGFELSMFTSIGGVNFSSSQAPLTINSVIRADGQARRPHILQSSIVTGNKHKLSFKGLLNDEEEHNDEYEDMCLDVDNINYEEITALEEKIGNVTIVPPTETTPKCLRRQIYQPITNRPRVHEPCCVCQEDYVAGDELGQLNCGHNYHFNCIKQWPGQENACPVCKNIALNI